MSQARPCKGLCQRIYKKDAQKENIGFCSGRINKTIKGQGIIPVLLLLPLPFLCIPSQGWRFPAHSFHLPNLLANRKTVAESAKYCAGIHSKYCREYPGPGRETSKGCRKRRTSGNEAIFLRRKLKKQRREAPGMCWENKKRPAGRPIPLQESIYSRQEREKFTLEANKLRRDRFHTHYPPSLKLRWTKKMSATQKAYWHTGKNVVICFWKKCCYNAKAVYKRLQTTNKRIYTPPCLFVYKRVINGYNIKYQYFDKIFKKNKTNKRYIYKRVRHKWRSDPAKIKHSR